jgi:hypothetical protein
MTIQELEQRLLSLDRTERQRLAQLLTQSLTGSIAPTSEKFTLTTAIAHFRNNLLPEELELNAEDVWQDVRDQTPVTDEPRW